MRTIVLLLIASLLATSLHRVGSAQERTGEVEQNETLRLMAENEKLRAQIVTMAQEIQELKKALEQERKEVTKEENQPDYLSVGTPWNGRMDGVGPGGRDRHTVTEAIITARTEQGFQMRMKGEMGRQWLLTCEGTDRDYRIVEFRLITSPDPNELLGPKLVNSSKVTVNIPKEGPPTMKIAMVRPVKGSGISVNYTLQTPPQ